MYKREGWVGLDAVASCLLGAKMRQSKESALVTVPSMESPQMEMSGWKQLYSSNIMALLARLDNLEISRTKMEDILERRGLFFTLELICYAM